MSLILDALKKVEREKDVAARGFSVHAATPWPARHRGRLTVVLGALLLVAAGIAVGLALRPSPAPAPGPAAAAPAPHTAQPAVTTPPVVSNQPSAPTPQAAAPAALPMDVPPPPRQAPRPAATAPPEEPLRLQAISQQDGRPVAVLNERVVHEGDAFDGVRVVRIGPGEVEVEVGGRRRTLTF